MDDNSELQSNSDEPQNNSRDYIVRVVGLVLGNLIGLTAMWLVAHQTEDWNSWANVVAVWILGLASLNVVIISTLTSTEMIETMRHQEIEMTQQRKTAQAQWKAMQDSLERTDTLIAQNESIVTATQRQAVASEKALKMTRDHFEYIERPVLGFEQITAARMPNGEGSAIGLLVNSGKVPGRMVMQVTGGAFLPTRGDIMNYDYPDVVPPTTKLLGAPTLHIGGKREVHFMPISSDDWKEVKAESKILFVYCKFIYRGLGSEREFLLEHFSAYNPRTGVFVECPTHNNVR